MKKSFRDPATNVLKAHGFVKSNAPGDLIRDELEDFNLEPGKWQFDSVLDDWIPFVPPIKTESDKLDERLKFDPQLDGIVAWVAQKFLITESQARIEITAIVEVKNAKK